MLGVSRSGSCLSQWSRCTAIALARRLSAAISMGGNAAPPAPNSVAGWWWQRGAITTDDLPTDDNRQLTALVGALLAPLLSVVFLTVLAMDSLWHVHYVIGFVLIPLVAVKLGSTGYRAASYYLGNRRYRTAGPPELTLRLLAPLLAASTVIPLVTGVMLWWDHSRSGPIATWHTDSAVVCAVTVGIHLMAYIPRAATASYRAARLVGSKLGALRLGAVAVVLVLGLVLAAATFSHGTWQAREFHDHFGGRP